jgi:hypothetical protein
LATAVARAGAAGDFLALGEGEAGEGAGLGAAAALNVAAAGLATRFGAVPEAA